MTIIARSLYCASLMSELMFFINYLENIFILPHSRIHKTIKLQDKKGFLKNIHLQSQYLNFHCNLR